MRGVSPACRCVAFTVMLCPPAAACSDERPTPEVEPDLPATIAQDTMDWRCLVLEGLLKCWADAGIEGVDPGQPDPNLDQVGRALYQRDYLRDGRPFPVVDFGGGDVASFAWSPNASCAAAMDGRVRCWGENLWNYLGVPDESVVLGDEPTERGMATHIVDLGAHFRAVQVVVGGVACARSRDGRVKCWGRHAGGLGLMTPNGRGDDAVEMGDALPYVALGSGVNAVGLTGDGAHTCIWTAEGRVKCWGDNSRGQLGISSANDVVGDEPGEMGDALPFVDLGPDVRVIQVTAAAHTCVLTDVGKIKCWGANSTPEDVDGNPFTDEVPSWFGRLGYGDRDDRRAPLTGLPDVDLGDGFVAQAVVARQWSSCAVSVDRRLKCWGAGPIGQGMLDEAIGDEPGEMGDDLPYVDLGRGRTVRKIDSTSAHCLMLDDDSVRCWTGLDRPLVGDEISPQATREDFYGP